MLSETKRLKNTLEAAKDMKDFYLGASLKCDVISRWHNLVTLLYYLLFGADVVTVDSFSDI